MPDGVPGFRGVARSGLPIVRDVLVVEVLELVNCFKARRNSRRLWTVNSQCLTDRLISAESMFMENDSVLRRHTVTLIGNERNEFGMPKPLHRYDIVAAPIGGPGGRALHVATILSTTGAPLPPAGEHYGSFVSEDDAIDSAVKAIVAANPSLHKIG